MNGFDLSEFSEMITQLEKFGNDLDSIAEDVLNAGSEPARQAFVNALPVDEDTPEDKRTYKHARDTVAVSKTKTAKKSRNKYRLIEAKTQKKDKNGNPIPYLYYVEYGSLHSPAKPWLEKAYRDAQAAASEPMRQALIKKFDEHMGG